MKPRKTQNTNLPVLQQLSFFFKNLFEKNDSSNNIPNDLKELIDKNYEDTALNTGIGICSYILTGSTRYVFEVAGFRISSGKVLKRRAQLLINAEKIKALDIGAGDFQFTKHNNEKYSGKVEAFGIAANDNWNLPEYQNIDPKHNIIGNAEYLSDVFGKNAFDYMFSRATFMHLTYVKLALEQAILALKPGGILMIDKFLIPGCEARFKDIMLDLKAQGYLVLAGQCIDGINNFIIQKPINYKTNHPTFPFEFKKIIEKTKFGGSLKTVIYEASANLKYRSQDNEVRLYQEGVTLILEKANQLNALLLKQCQSLPELFSSTIYRALDYEQQHLFILAMIAKTHPSLETFVSAGNIVRDQMKEANFLTKDAFQFIVQDQTFEAVYYLAWSGYLESIANNQQDSSCVFEKQLAWLQFAGMREITLLAEQKEAAAILTQMGIPLVAIRVDYNHNFNFDYLRIKNSKLQEDELTCTRRTCVL